MPQLSLELMLLMLLAFLIGCIVGCLFRTMFATDQSPAVKPAKTSDSKKETVAADGPQPETAPVAVSKTKPAPEPKPEPDAKPAPEAKPAISEPAAKAAAAPVATGKPVRPKGLPGARDGKPDKLQMISGVGPKLEKTLHGLGYFHFDQIAAWGQDQVDWVDEHLRYKGRIERDEWIAQAKLLAADDIEQFNKLYGTGGSAKARPAKPKPASEKK
ncbi:MAG: NADH:ubiquinone oxidoreductase [Anderseniella sp.]|nr:NADH:ubiquinone oxidoreductase [Anderseniella sp.]